MRVGVEDPVVALAGRRVVDLRVVDHVVGAERADEVELVPCWRRRSPRRPSTSRSGPRTDRRCPTRRRSAPCRPAGPSGRCAAGAPAAPGSPSAGASRRPRTTCRPASVRRPSPARTTYSANAPLAVRDTGPTNTRSPGLNRVTSGPTASTTPATSMPDALVPAARAAPGTGATNAGRGVRPSRSARLTDAARTRTSTWSSRRHRALDVARPDDVGRAVPLPERGLHRPPRGRGSSPAVDPASRSDRPLHHQRGNAGC